MLQIPRQWCLAALLICALPAVAQDGGEHVGLPIDWSFHHVVTHNKVDATFNDLAGQEPRVVYNWLQRARARQGAQVAGQKHTPVQQARRAAAKLHSDWHFTLGAGTIAPNMYPAKYSFNVNATADCAKDYVVYAINGANGSSTQPELVGFNNLYSGPTGASANIRTTSLTGATVTVTTDAAHGFTAGQTVMIQGVAQSPYDGVFAIATVPTTTTFTYTLPAIPSGVTASQGGTATITQPISTATVSGNTVTVTTVTAHNLSTGNYVTVQNINPPSYNGTYQVTVTGTTTFTYTIPVAPAGAGSGGNATAGGYCGVGAFVSSTSVIASLVEAGNTVTVNVPPTAPHGFSNGDVVTIVNASPAGFNGTYRINVVSKSSFTYTNPTSGLGTGGFGTATDTNVFWLGPKVAWAYNVTSGQIATSPAISLDGTKVAFVENIGTKSNFNVLTIGTTGSNGSFNVGLNQYAAAPVGSGNNAVLSSFAAQLANNATLSSPFIDYNHDVAYFGDDNGNLYKTNCVFYCSGALTNTVLANVGSVKLGPVVVDVNTNKLFVGGSDGNLYSCSTSSCTPASVAVGSNTAHGAIIDAPLVDTTFQTLFVTTGQAASNNAAIVQLNENLSSLATVPMSTHHYAIANGALDDEYYNNSIGSATVTGNGYFCGPGNGSGQAFLYSTSFSAVGALSTSNPPLIGLLTSANIPGNATTPCGTMLSFTNGITERLFFSQPTVPTNGCAAGSATDGCLSAYPIQAGGTLGTSTTASVHGSASAATSGIVVDNVSTLPQASSLYFATQNNPAINVGSNSAPDCTYGTASTMGFCAVKLTQAGLQ